MKVIFEFEVDDDCDVDMLQEAITVFIHEGEENITPELNDALACVQDMRRL